MDDGDGAGDGDEDVLGNVMTNITMVVMMARLGSHIYIYIKNDLWFNNIYIHTRVY